MFRIFRLINRFNLGGPTYNVTYLTKFLPPEYETILAGGVKDESEESSEYVPLQYGIQPLVIHNMHRSINPVNDLAAYKEIKKIITKFKPHIVHTHASKAGFLGRLAAVSCKVPVIVHTFHGHVFHSYFDNIQTQVYKNIERYMATKSTALVAISQKQKHELSEIHRIAPPEKFHIVPLGFDFERFWTGQEEKRKIFRQRYGLDDKTTAIGIMGRLVPIKNHSLFLKAYSKAKKAHIQTQAFIIGDGELKEKLIGECKELGLSVEVENGKWKMENESQSPANNFQFSTFNFQLNKADVIFTSWIKEADIAVAGLDIVALSSLNEGTPVSLIEAQAASKPVVSTRTGGIENAVIENGTALLSPVSDVERYAENMLRLMNDAALRTEFSKNGKKFVMKNYTHTSLVNNMDILYKSLLKNCKMK